MSEPFTDRSRYISLESYVALLNDILSGSVIESNVLTKYKIWWSSLERYAKSSSYGNTDRVHDVVRTILEGPPKMAGSVPITEPIAIQVSPTKPRLVITLKKPISNPVIPPMVFDFPESSMVTLAKSTVRAYKSTLNQLWQKLGYPSASSFYMSLKDGKEMIEQIDGLPSDMLSFRSKKKVYSVINGLSTYDDKYREYLKDTASWYIAEFSRLKIIADELEIENNDNIKAIDWEVIKSLRSEYLGYLNEPSNRGQVSLWLCMMTMMPPLRDDYGSVRIWDDSPIPELPMESQDNYYHPKEGKLLLYIHKNCRRDGLATIVVPDELRVLILDSIEARGLTFGINDMRHSFITYIWDKSNGISGSMLVKCAESMCHALSTAINKYIRYGDPTETDSNLAMRVIDSLKKGKEETPLDFYDRHGFYPVRSPDARYMIGDVVLGDD